MESADPTALSHLRTTELDDGVPQGWDPPGPVYRILLSPKLEDDEVQAEIPGGPLDTGTRRAYRVCELWPKEIRIQCTLTSSHHALAAVQAELVFAHTPTYPETSPLLRARG